MLGTMRRHGVIGWLCLLAACGGGGGGGGGGSTPVTPQDAPPVVRATASGAVQMTDGAMHATLAGQVTLDASGSSDADSDALTYAWSLVSAPKGSTLTLSATTAAVDWRADTLGTYVFAVTVTDVHGATSTQQVSVIVDNTAPAASVVVATTFAPVLTQAPTQEATVGGSVVLDATNTTDPDGDAVQVTFDLVPPAGSTASLVVNGRTARFSPDVLGTYVTHVHGVDPHGAAFETDYTFNADNRAPTAAVAVAASFQATVTQAPAQDVSVGASVAVDASNTTDPDGDAVQVTFDMTAPSGSTARLVVAGRAARFSADVLGAYVVRVHGVDTHGASFETDYTFDADNRAPNPITSFDVHAMVADAGSASVTTSIGYDVAINGGASTDPDGDALTYLWALSAKPAGSTAALTGAAGATSRGLSPDVLGDYVVVLTVTDSHGAQSRRTLTVTANNRRPNAVLTTNATPQALPSAPSTTVPLGTKVTLSGSASTDADGDAITYAWSIDNAPTGSHAALSATNATSPTFTADVEGAYVFRLRATDTHAAFSERTVTLNVGTHPPVAVIDRTAVTVQTGTAASASAALSFDEDGDPLTYQWTVDARPSGSTATIASATAAAVGFTPDAAGLYVLAAHVSDGHRTSVAYVSVHALAAFQASVALNYTPLISHYDTGLDKLVIASNTPNALHVVDPFSGVQTAVALPTAVKQSFHLSPDGHLAVVLHEGAVSLIDLTTNTLLHTSSTAGSQTEAFVTNLGIVYAIGQTGGQWVDTPITVLDGRTGAMIPVANTFYSTSQFYGTQVAVMVPSLGRIVYESQGLSPSSLWWFSYDPTGTQAIQTGGSPYWGNYANAAPFWVASDDSLLFTSSGTYYKPDTLTYAGLLSGVNRVLSLDDAASLQEALVLTPTYDPNDYYGTPRYPSTYLRFTGPLLLPDTSMTLPTIGGRSSYGIAIFHSATGRHVALVQTGGDSTTDPTGLSYAVVAR